MSLRRLSVVLNRCRSFVTQSSPTTFAQVVESEKVRDEVVKSISENLNESRQRLFAVVYVNGRQWKVSDGDLISLEGYTQLNVGDEIRLEKILMLGGANFSLFGRPLLDKNAAEVRAIVVEKKNKAPELKYVHLNHFQTKVVNWQSEETTVLRIQSVLGGK